jgi:hypothetical protein
VDTIALRELVASPAYRRIVFAVVPHLRVRFEDGDGDSTVYTYYARGLWARGVSVDDLAGLLAQEGEQIAAYAAAVHQAMHDEPDEQEYPPGEEPDPDEADELLDTWMDPLFLIGYLAEYWFLTRDPAGLVPYLRAMKMVRPTAYAKQVEAIHAATRKAG